MKKNIIYISGILSVLWGVAHQFPTAGVVREFGDISLYNKYIITMEWIVEGLSLIFLGVLSIVVTKTDAKSKLAKNVYILTICMLLSLAVLSLFTGFKVKFLPFKLCPIIFSVSAILIIIGMKPRAERSN